MSTARILIIAGSDSGGGAGIQADIKTVTMLGGHAMTAITAVTAQNTMGVERIVPLPADLVVQQMASVAEDIGTDAIKIGMLGGHDISNAVANELKTGIYHTAIVFDPVMVATSGAHLADSRTIETMDRLAMMSRLVTPNLTEMAVICGQEIIDSNHAEAEAKRYAERVGASVLVKGGHAEGALITDILVETDGTVTRWTGERIKTTSTHGTGCTLATAIATGLGQGMDLKSAIVRARQFVWAALLAAPGLGSGHGPMGHQAVDVAKL
jgi:hydroxymethylpyrimidine/phosphomethylpyrimidine kinase